MMYKGLTGSALILVALAGCDRRADNHAEAADSPAQPAAAAAAAGRPTDPEIVQGLSGRTARVTLADGRVIEVSHNVDGTARMRSDDGLDETGRWSVSQGKLCFDWPGQERECWPYGGPLIPGETVRSTSDRGQVITTTLLPDGETGETATNTAAPAPTR